ncbi:MAG TPA: hypothetical protein VJH65_03590 [Candidatus Nanoarchaeia archaeon]|nr:hypothetical protein [Candidatus Pacearchaeota archaeon]HLC87329.1 hypothetical protein [Candidatus Nanoarchaeia archaeon]
MSKKTTLSIISIMLILSIISLASAIRIDSVSMNPESIAPGETSEILITLKNNADIDIEDVSVNLDLTNVPFAPFESGSDFFTNEIQESKSKTAEFKVVALNDAKSGIYKIPIKISYIEDNVAKTQSSLISIMINSQPIIEVSVDDGLLLKGKENKVTFKIVNKGLADAKFLEIETKGSTSYSILSAEKVYVGDVDSDDFQTVDYQIFFNQNSLNRLDIPVTIKYKDVANKEYTQEFNPTLKVYTLEQAQNLGLIAKSNTTSYIVGVVILIIIFFVYRWFRRRRKRKEEY